MSNFFKFYWSTGKLDFRPSESVSSTGKIFKYSEIFWKLLYKARVVFAPIISGKEKRWEFKYSALGNTFLFIVEAPEVVLLTNVVIFVCTVDPFTHFTSYSHLQHFVYYDTMVIVIKSLCKVCV